MKSIIIYGSRYGSARRYAQELSKQTGIPDVSYQEAPLLSELETVVYIGALYAGGVLGLTKTLRRQSFEKHQRLIIVTVGLADPDIPQNRENIRNALQKQIHAQLYGRAAIFHLRGAIDYQALSLGHRTMMALLHRSLQKKPAEEWSEEDKALMETYGKQADFVDFASPVSYTHLNLEWSLTIRLAINPCSASSIISVKAGLAKVTPDQPSSINTRVFLNPFSFAYFSRIDC